MYGLIPAPVSVEVSEGHCLIGCLPGFGYEKQFEPEVSVVASWLAQQLPKTIPEEYRQADIISINVYNDLVKGGTEAYKLFIRPTVIEIHVASAAGVVRAGATLAQLVSAHGCRLPCLSIEDQPRYSWRGFMLDTVRNFFSVDFILRQLDLAALHKLNMFHWHLSDDQAWRLDLEEMPELAAHGAQRLDRRFNVVKWKGGSYSAADVRRVVEFAASRHISVIPEIDVPGHSSALLASHPELWCRSAHDDRHFLPEDRYGIFDAVLCAGRDESLNLVGRVFSGLSGLFPGKYLHAGGDEVPKEQWLVCEHCRARMRDEGLQDKHGNFDPERLQAWFMEQVQVGINGLGRTMVGWDELVDGGCSRDVLIMAWRSTGHGAKAAELGYKVVMCPQNKACYLDHKHLDLEEEPGQLGICTVRDAYAFDPHPEGLSAAAAANILGGQANLWTELVYFGKQAEYMLYPRLSAIAEALWSPKAVRDFASFASRLELHGRFLDRLQVNRYRGPLE
ncbi:MAG: beta-N-acetylhexosaminidase [Spirochaetes bacterium]|nr:beta-N-acetylhexosaminidase [Spirochaetota bacterium]MBU0956652.1 beta-N-acetylhexosaminidase [Spirochaetota bacterium]